MDHGDDLIARALIMQTLTGERGEIASRTLPDGRIIDVIPLIPGTWRIGISRDTDARAYDDVF